MIYYTVVCEMCTNGVGLDVVRKSVAAWNLSTDRPVQIASGVVFAQDVQMSVGNFYLNEEQNTK
jgi:hypothetical protein